MSLVKLGIRASKIARAVPSTCRNMSMSAYTIANRITLYDVPNLVTTGDIRRAIADKTEGVMNVQIDYKGFRPSGKAMLTMDNPEFLAKNLRALKSLHICGVKVRPVAHYSPDSWAFDSEESDQGVTGNGPEGNFPHVERNVVLWGMPGRTTVDDIALALKDFKVERKKEKPIIVKLGKPTGSFTLFSRFVVTMASVSEARRLVRAWHMTPWKQRSTDLIRAQVLY